MYSLNDFGSMIADETRMPAYVEALHQAVTSGCTVLDIGTGTGIFALLACQFGAGKVYAVETNDLIQLAQQLAADNGYSDKIAFIQERSDRISLPERVDVMIADLHGTLPFYQAHLPSIIDARQRHLAPTGIQLPQRDVVWAAVVNASASYDKLLAPWSVERYHLQMGRAQEMAMHRWQKQRDQKITFLSKPQQLMTIDYRTVVQPDASTQISMEIMEEQIGHGYSVWFDTEVTEGIYISNAPGQPEMVYGNAFFPWSKPVPLAVGDCIEMTLKAKLIDDDYLWSWKTAIYAQGNPTQCIATFQQSTFHGSPLSRDTLRKQTVDYKPKRSTDGEVQREILSMMDGQTPLNQIAEKITACFPHRFTNEKQAMAVVCKLSNKYGL